MANRLETNLYYVVLHILLHINICVTYVYITGSQSVNITDKYPDICWIFVF